MTDHALVIGGTRFIGRHTVSELLDAGYEVTLFNRGTHENPFADDERVDHIEGDRTKESDIRRAGLEITPDIVVDCAAYRPRDVHTATDVFADVDAYVYVSSGAAYGAERIPKREGETPLRSCSVEEATDDSDASYGPRKAEGDRAVVSAADRGVNAMSSGRRSSTAPTTTPSGSITGSTASTPATGSSCRAEGSSLWQLAYVGDVARALRLVAERGKPRGGVQRRRRPRADTPRVGRSARRGVRYAGRSRPRRRARTRGRRPFAGLVSAVSRLPHLLDTTKLRELGWEPTPHGEAVPETVREHRDSERTGGENGPDRQTEDGLIDVLGTVE